MLISKRLSLIGDLVTKDSVVADIGTDHGLVPNYLVENNISKNIICTDISYDSLKKSIDYTSKLGNKEHISSRVGNGLEVINIDDGVETLIIAGMGGLLIADILNKELEKTKRIPHLILQPMQASDKLRKYLYNNDFIILDEHIVFEDNRYFEILSVGHGKTDYYREIDTEISPVLISKKEQILKDFLNYKITATEEIIGNIALNSLSKKSTARIEELKLKVKAYKEILHEL